MALGQLIEAVISILALPFPSRRPKTESERIQSVFAIVFWLILLAAALIGLAAWLDGKV